MCSTQYDIILFLRSWLLNPIFSELSRHQFSSPLPRGFWNKIDFRRQMFSRKSRLLFFMLLEWVLGHLVSRVLPNVIIEWTKVVKKVLLTVEAFLTDGLKPCVLISVSMNSNFIKKNITTDPKTFIVQSPPSSIEFDFQNLFEMLMFHFVHPINFYLFMSQHE